MSAATFRRPFPPLTPAQRYHLEVFGYVVLENALSRGEVERLKGALLRLFADLEALEDRGLNGPRVGGAFLGIDKPCHKFAVNILESDPAITAYATHPYMVSLAEELIGGEARIVEMNAHINSRDPDNTWEKGLAGFHRGTDVPYAGHTHGGLFHCNFVKTLTNLTDLGPDDGGTAVIAGSHKIDAPPKELIALAEEDRSLVHQVVAPAGSTLLFCETLVHSTGPIRSGRERIIIITGYGSTMFPYWDYGDLSPGFRERIPEQLKVLFEGKQVWTRGARYRDLATPADERRFALGEWDDRPAASDEDLRRFTSPEGYR
ncbi:MAG: phytanoyl-CoA dioxygenase family protein [Gemmatimonadetes bacterium]|nr:phytanoyl-CoA dioxygenase family protein [Gemmatimonadota bacterium]